jgi:hypothetical protein
MPRVETTNIGRRPVRAISTSVTIGGFEVMCRRFIDFEPADVAALRALPGIEVAVPRPVLPPNVTTAEAGDGEPVVMRWVSVKHPLTLIENYCYAYPLVTGTPLYVSGRDPHARPRRDFVRGSSEWGKRPRKVRYSADHDRQKPRPHAALPFRQSLLGSKPGRETYGSLRNAKTLLRRLRQRRHLRSGIEVG